MRTAEFRLRFYSEEEADKACKICRREAEGTGWQEAVQAEDWMVWADSCAVSDDPDFSTDSFEDGEMLFQRMCFRIASEMPETTVTGSCNITDSKDNERIRITAGAENDTLRFALRRYTDSLIRYRTIYWDREEDGRYTKSEFGTDREMDISPRKEGNFASVRRFSLSDVTDVMNDPEVQEYVRKAEEELGEEGRFIVRFSGIFTENRVMAETDSREHSERLIDGFIGLLYEKGYIFQV